MENYQGIHINTGLKVKGYGATGGLIGGKTLKEMDIQRHAPKRDEVLIEVLYCGVCHSDIHQVNNDWRNTIYPCVPGHEIIGKIAETGDSVTAFKKGDIVGNRVLPVKSNSVLDQSA